MITYLSRLLLKIFAYFIISSIALVLIFKWLPPPTTAIILEQQITTFFQKKPLKVKHNWRSWEKLPNSLKIAVIAAEDQKFPYHWGFDIQSIEAAFKHNRKGHAVRGASTISQQVSKNLFLWPARTWVRKGLETWFTVLIELFWSKQHILETYLNSAEWASGVFGAEAAAQYYFHVPAKNLTNLQSNLLAAILPNPKSWSASHPTSYVKKRATWIQKQIKQLGSNNYLKQLKKS